MLSMNIFRKSRSIIHAFYSVQCLRGVQTASDAAKDVSYARGIFLGVNCAQKAFPYPRCSSDERETLQMLVDPVERFFSDKVNSKAIDETKLIPEETLQGIKDLGLFGLQIPQEHNGLGLSNTAYARICEVLSQDASIAVTVMAHQSIGLKGILLNGNAEQQEKYLPKLSTGEHIAAFALTEPSSGSDAASIRTRAVRSEGGMHYILNGSKIWISNGGWADIMTVFAQTEVDGEDKITAFLVERSFGGVTSGPPEDKLGIRGSNTCQVFFDNVQVPIDNILGGGPDGKTGGEAGVGQGFKVAMNILNNGRFGLGAGAGGQLKKIIGQAAEHVTTRKQFGSELSDFGLIKEKFAKMTLNAYAIESMAYLTTGMIDRGDPSCEIEAAMCKVFGSEVAFEGINECIQVMGGTGFMKEWPFERIMRDCRILSIFEGTNEILRLLIALSGVKCAGERLSKVGKLLSNPLASPGKALTEVSERIQRRWAPKPLVGVHPKLKGCGELLQRRTGEFAGSVETLIMKHKKEIMQEQLQLRRLADCAIDLFAMTATISRASSSIESRLHAAEHEEKLCKLFCEIASDRIVNNISDINKLVGRDNRLNEIADEVFAELKYLPEHPSGVDSKIYGIEGSSS